MKFKCMGASLVTQWLKKKSHLPMQEKQVQSLIWEDPTCHRATKPMGHNYWACALEPRNHNYWAPLHHKYWSLCTLEIVLCNKRSHHNEMPTPCGCRVAPALHNQRKVWAATKTQHSQKWVIYFFKEKEKIILKKRNKQKRNNDFLLWNNVT